GSLGTFVLISFARPLVKGAHSRRRSYAGGPAPFPNGVHRVAGQRQDTGAAQGAPPRLPINFFLKEVTKKQATLLPRQDLLDARNHFRLNFRGRRLDEFSIFPRPPPQGPLPHAGMRGIPSDGRCRAGPPICLGRASDACVLGAI